MKKNIAILATLAAMIYGATAYTRPHEPAGRWIHQTALPAIKDAMPELPRLPFSGLLKWSNDYQPRPTLQPLEVVPASATPYTPAELAEIYPSH